MKLFLILLIFSSAASQAAPYFKYKDKNGAIIYSDTPPYAGAVPLNAPKLQTTPAIKIKPKEKKPEPVAKKAETKYLSFAIFQPLNEATIRDNEGNIPITLKLIPELNTREGHYLNYFLDGKLVKKKSTALNVTLNDVDRGSHKIKAEIRNKKGKLLKTTPSSVVNLHRISILHKRGP